MRQTTGRTLLGLLPLLFISLFIGIAPFGDAFVTSFFHDAYGTKEFAGLDNYRFLFSDKGFSYSLSITILWAVLNSFLSIFLGFIFAAAMATRFKRLSSAFYAVLLIPWGIPVYIAVPLWRAVIHGNGGVSLLTRFFGISINLMMQPVMSFISVLVVSLWMMVPLTTFVLYGSLRKTPKSITEAACIEGAKPVDLAFGIYLPGMWHSLLVMGLLNFIKALKEFTVVFLMTSGGPPLVSGITDHHIIGATTTLGVLIYELFSETDDLGLTASYAMVMTAIVAIIMVFWLLVRRKKKATDTRIILFAALTQPLFFMPWGLVWTGCYLLTLRYKKLYPIVLAAEIVQFTVLLVTKSFLAALHPGMITAVLALFFLGETEKRSGIKTFFSTLFAGVKRTELRRAGTVRIDLLRETFWNLLTDLLVIVMVLSSLLVLFLLGWMSLSGVSTTYVDSLIPPYFSVSSFISIVKDERIFTYFLNTFIVAGLTGILIPLVSFPAAAVLSLNKPSTGKSVLFAVQLLGIAGGMHTLIPLYSLFLKIGLINSFVPLVMIYIFHAIPFSLFTMKTYLDSIPTSFRDYASLEGAGPLHYTFKILFPVSFPVITTAVIVAFLGGWNGFMAPLLFLNDEAKYTISIKLFSLVGSIASGEPKWNLFAAASTINMVLIGFLFLRFKNPLSTTPLKDYQE